MISGASILDNFRRAVEYVDRIREGARPGDHPIERWTKPAKALGLPIPPSLLIRADEVIWQ
jgi:hypothetical protein